MTTTMRRITSRASKTSKSVMTSARKSNGKVMGSRRGIAASVVRRERGVPRMIIVRFRYSLACIVKLLFEGRFVCPVMVWKKPELSGGIVNVVALHSDDHDHFGESKMSRRRHRTPFFSIVVQQAQNMLLPHLQSSTYACRAILLQRQHY